MWNSKFQADEAAATVSIFSFCLKAQDLQLSTSYNKNEENNKKYTRPLILWYRKGRRRPREMYNKFKYRW